jgi:hypothetical protein
MARRGLDRAWMCRAVSEDSERVMTCEWWGSRNVGNDEMTDTQREQLQKEYDLLQKKIDTHSTFKFLIRGWSFTATGAAAVSLVAKDLDGRAGTSVFVALAIAVVVFHVMATEQALLVRSIIRRATVVERDLSRLWPTDEAGTGESAPRRARVGSSPGLARAMKSRRYSASEIVLATFLPIAALVAVRNSRSVASIPPPPAIVDPEGQHQRSPTRRPFRLIRFFVRLYGSAVLRAAWILSSIRSKIMTSVRPGTFRDWWGPRFIRIKEARDDTHLFWVQLLVLGAVIWSATRADKATTPIDSGSSRTTGNSTSMGMLASGKVSNDVRPSHPSLAESQREHHRTLTLPDASVPGPTRELLDESKVVPSSNRPNADAAGRESRDD